MATSSASPDNLEQFVTRAGGASDSLASRLAALKAQLDEYLSLPSDYRLVNGDAIVGEAIGFNDANKRDEAFVAAVRKAFIEADTNTLPDGAIEKALAEAGVSAAPRTAITVDEPLFRGLPISSGWSDDPVCTATGHFLEAETDIAMPEVLRALAWPRTYSSRFIAPTSLARGWYTWADTVLVEEDGEARYQGPDGQLATFPGTRDGFAVVAGVAARAIRLPGGLGLRWRWDARFPGQAWDYDASGALIRIGDPFGGVTTVERDGAGRLSALCHEGGRRLEVEWAGGLIAGLVASDGREVRYTYRDGNLAAVDRPGGGRTYQADAGGRILEVRDADGVLLAGNRYDDAGRVLSQQSPFGRVTRYRYLAPRTVIVGDDEGGPATLYRHDAAGRLVELHTAAGTRATRQFDLAGNPLSVVWLDGGRTDREFDPQGNCVAETRADGSRYTWGYDQSGRVTALTDAAGARFAMSYEGDGALPTQIEGPLGRRWAIDSDRGLPQRIIDADGVSWSYVRDTDGSLVEVTVGDVRPGLRLARHPSGAVSEVVLPTGERWAYELDGAGRVLAVTEPGGARSIIERSPAGRVRAADQPGRGRSAFGWGSHGALDAVTDPSGALTRLGYDVQGNVIDVTWPNGGRWGFAYDGLGALVRTEDPGGGVWSQERSPGGHPLGVTDPVGNTSRHEWDLMGRETAVVTALGRRVDLGLDAMGLPVRAATSQGAEAELVRDVLGQVIEARRDGQAVLRGTYTAAGRLVSLVRPDGSSWRWRYDAAGRVASVDLPEGGSVTLERDVSGRPVAVVNATGTRTELSWATPERLGEIRRAGETTRLSWDAAGQLIAVTLPDGSTIRYRWECGQPIEVADALGNATRMERDELGRLTSILAPDGARWAYRRDPLGRLTGATDPLGRSTQLAWDPAGRLEAVRLPDGQGRQYRWDPEGRLAGIATPDGPLLEVEAVLGERSDRVTGAGSVPVTLTWDAQGRLTGRQVGPRHTQIHYDDEGTGVTVELPGGERVAMRLDAAGNVVSYQRSATGAPPSSTTGSATGSATGFATASAGGSAGGSAIGEVTIVRDPDGRPVRLEAAGLLREWQRDARGRLVGYRQEAGGQTDEVELERDAAGRLVRQRHNGEVTAYRHDAAGQLIAADGPEGSWAWRYDRSGRLIEESGPEGHRSFTYDAAGQLTAIQGPAGTTRVRYDDAGRRIGEEGPGGRSVFAWDGLGRLTGVEQPGAGIELGLDALGTVATVDGQACDWLPVPGDVDALARIGEHWWAGLPGMPIGTGNGAPPQVEPAGWRGSRGHQERPWGTPPAPAQPGPGFLGELQVGGLAWLRNRAYDPATHSFLSRDPFGGPLWASGGPTNPYGYANNDPLDWFDPLGLHPLTIDQAKEMMQSWKQGHLGEVLVTVAAVAGTAVLIAATGGAGMVIFGAVAGTVLGGGGTLVTDAITHQPIDPMSVITNAAVGAFGGALLGAIPAPDAVLGRIGLGVAVSTPYAAATSALTQYVETGAVSGKDLAFNTATGAVGGLIPGFKDTDFNVPGLRTPEGSSDVPNMVIQGHYQPIITSVGAIFQGRADGVVPAPATLPPGPVTANLAQLIAQLQPGA